MSSSYTIAPKGTMDYRYLKWLLRALSLAAIAIIGDVEFRWLATLRRDHLLIFAPIAVLPLMLSVCFFLLVKIRELPSGAPVSPLIRALRPEFIKFATLTAGAMFLSLFQGN